MPQMPPHTATTVTGETRIIFLFSFGCRKVFLFSAHGHKDSTDIS